MNNEDYIKKLKKIRSDVRFWGKEKIEESLEELIDLMIEKAEEES